MPQQRVRKQARLERRVNFGSLTRRRAGDLEDARTVSRHGCDKRWQRKEIERTVGAFDHREWCVLIRCGMQLASEIVVETIQREERRVRQKRTKIVLASAVDDRRVLIEDVERAVRNDSHANCVHSDDYQLAEDETWGEFRCHFLFNDYACRRVFQMECLADGRSIEWEKQKMHSLINLFCVVHFSRPIDCYRVS